MIQSVIMRRVCIDAYARVNCAASKKFLLKLCGIGGMWLLEYLESFYIRFL